MTNIDLLRCLKAETEKAVSDIIMNTSAQDEDGTIKKRAAEVYLMQLPDSSAAKEKAPYIIHRIVTGKDTQDIGKDMSSIATVQSVFCVYHEDEQEGSLALLNLMERLRIHFLKHVTFDRRYTLNLQSGLEKMIYQEELYPYYIGEMFSTWNIPKIQREVDFINGF